MGNKVPVVPRFAAQHSEAVLQRRERTHGACALDDEAPRQRRNMEPYRARPSQNEQRTCRDEEYEEKMDERNGISKDGVPHDGYASPASAEDSGG